MLSVTPILTLLIMILSGCSSHFNNTYASANKVDVEVAGATYVIHDRPDLSSLYVRSSVGSAFSNSTKANTATDGANDVLMDSKIAAQRYLKDLVKRDCTLDAGKEILSLQYEFKYKCK